MILAETVSLDGGALLVILVIFLAVLAAWCAVMVLGCVWAVRAGRGSRLALAGWGVVALIELLPAAGALGSILALPALVFVLQVGLYFWAKSQAQSSALTAPAADERRTSDADERLPDDDDGGGPGL